MIWEKIIICADNDEHKPNSQAYKTIEKTQIQFQAQDKSVSIIKPIQPGDDFNDVLKKKGSIGVQEYVKPYLNSEKQSADGLLLSKKNQSCTEGHIRSQVFLKRGAIKPCALLFNTAFIFLNE